MSVTTGEREKKQKATDMSKPLKNVTVFVEDLASGMAVCENHSCSRHSRSSGEMVNIKGFAGAFLMKALDRRFVYDLQKRRRKSVIAPAASFASQARPCRRKRHLQVQFQVFIVVIRNVQVLHFIILCECNKAIAAFKNIYWLREEDLV